MDELVIATGNPHKVAELRAILGGLGLRVVGLKDLEAAGEGPFVEPEETGDTFEANATIKALSYAGQTGRMCLADDSGLEIDALGGRPGVISSHYCTDGVEKGMSREERDGLNNARVMEEMEGEEQRSARFVCVMVLANTVDATAPRDDAARVLAVTRGEFEGRMGSRSDVPRGDNGFGYDPLFLVAPGFEQTSAELESKEKNSLSHRASAAKAIVARIRELRDKGE